MKPEVVLEFDLLDIKIMNPGPAPTTSGTPSPKETLVLRDPGWIKQSIQIYAVVDGVVTPIGIPGDVSRVEIVVTR